MNALLNTLHGIFKPVRQVMTVFRKELGEALRDQRSLSMALMYVLMMPMMVLVVAKVQPKPDLSVWVDGAEHAPKLMQFLENHQVAVNIGESQAATATVQLAVPTHYAQTFQRGEPVVLVLTADMADKESKAIAQGVQRLIAQYANQTASQRLIFRGISSDLVAPLRIDLKDTASALDHQSMMFDVLNYALLMALFAAGMFIAIDSSAGERERKSVESLFCRPIAMRNLLMGKWLNISTFSLAGGFLSLGLVFGLFNSSLVNRFPVAISIDPFQVLQLVLITLPLGLLASAIMLTTGWMAKSFKEAQLYMTILTLLPMVPTFLLDVSDATLTLKNLLTPLVSHSLLIKQVLLGNEVLWSQLVIVGGSTLCYVAALMNVMGRLFTQERLVFNQ